MSISTRCRTFKRGHGINNRSNFLGTGRLVRFGPDKDAAVSTIT